MVQSSAPGRMSRQPAKDACAGTGAAAPSSSERMRRQATRDTAPEMEVRRHLHAAGLRYRVHTKPLPQLRRTADVVFRGARVAVFVDGCFWHSCPEHGTAPVTNGEWWAAKLSRNVKRDADTDRQLTDAGWLVLRVWEHEDPVVAAERVARAVRSRQT